MCISCVRKVCVRSLPINILTSTYISNSTHIGLGARIGASSFIKPLSVVKRGRKIPENATLVGDTTSMEASTKDISYIEDEAVSLGWHTMSLLISFLPASIVILISIWAIYVTSLHGYFGPLVGLYPFVITVAQILAALCMLPLRKVLHGGGNGKAKTGESRVYSKTFMKHMLAKSLYHSTLRYVQGTLVSRLVSKYIYGADIDVHASYLPFVEEPDLTKIGKNVFGANGKSSSLYKKVHIICTYHSPRCTTHQFCLSSLSLICSTS